MKKRIRLSESGLRNIINEGVRSVLSELDWRTYASAAEKARTGKNAAYNDETDTNPRARRFSDMAAQQFADERGYDCFDEHGYEYGVKSNGYGGITPYRKGPVTIDFDENGYPIEKGDVVTYDYEDDYHTHAYDDYSDKYIQMMTDSEDVRDFYDGNDVFDTYDNTWRTEYRDDVVPKDRNGYILRKGRSVQFFRPDWHTVCDGKIVDTHLDNNGHLVVDIMSDDWGYFADVPANDCSVTAAYVKATGRDRNGNQIKKGTEVLVMKDNRRYRAKVQDIEPSGIIQVYDPKTKKSARISQYQCRAIF